MTDHIFDQYTKAKSSEETARKEVRAVIDRWLKLVDRIDKLYATISFEYTDETGGFVKSELPNAINIDDQPTLRDICAATERYQEAYRLRRQLEEKMTPDQRSVLNIRSR
jgi:hypothetical protein